MEIADFLNNDVERFSGEIFEVPELDGASSPLLYIRLSLGNEYDDSEEEDEYGEEENASFGLQLYCNNSLLEVKNSIVLLSQEPWC